MKKIVLAVFAVFVLVLPGCSQKQSAAVVSGAAGNHGKIETADMNADVIEIKEKLFIAQTNDIYLNVDQYLGKTIKYEGIFTTFTYGDSAYDYVIRYGPGCCGTDGNAGFEVSWSGNRPAENDWVEAVGILEIYEEEDGSAYLRLNLDSLTVLDKRGAEFVS
jgi:uncharacterized membrane protein YcgQ (UPF0703/DUF1980 family)